MKKRTLPLDLTTYAIEAQYVTIRERPVAFEFRSATIRYRDRNHVYGQVVDIMVRGTKTRPGDQDPEILEWVQLFHPEFWMHSGSMRLKGFVQVIVQDGKLLDKERGTPEAPMRFIEMDLTPEAALDDDGEYRTVRKVRK